MIAYLKKNSFRKFLLGVLLFVIAYIFVNKSFLPIVKYVYEDKIWAHRVNSTIKLDEVSNKFSGIELDVVYDSINNIFDVNHPPAKSISLSLHKYLKSYNGKQSIWLDFKNLDAVNAKKSYEKLKDIVNELKIDSNKIIVESTNVEDVKVFNKEFKTSFYLPYGIDTLSKKKIDSLKKSYNKSPTDYVSFSYIYYKLVKEYFPNQEKLSWMPDNVNKIKMLKILNDSTVKVLLVKYESKKGGDR